MALGYGNGVYKTIDGGKSWKNMGLEKTGRIGRVIVHPTNPDIVYAAALGHTFGPQQERGVFKTTDGGNSWISQNSGVSVNAVCPGWVRTEMGGNNAPKSPKEGAETIIWLATQPDNSLTGGFYRDKEAISW